MINLLKNPIILGLVALFGLIIACLSCIGTWAGIVWVREVTVVLPTIIVQLPSQESVFTATPVSPASTSLTRAPTISIPTPRSTPASTSAARTATVLSRISTTTNTALPLAQPPISGGLSNSTNTSQPASAPTTAPIIVVVTAAPQPTSTPIPTSTRTATPTATATRTPTIAPTPTNTINPKSPFGTGADGSLTVTSNQTINTTRTMASVNSNASQSTLNVASTAGFGINQEVLVHQTQGTGAGNYEFGRIASIGSGTLTLQENLQNIYTQGGASRTQVIRVPNYADVTVQNGATLTAPAWDGSTGGILVFRASGTTNVAGTISASFIGYRGGAGQQCTGAWSGEGFGGGSVFSQNPTGHNGGGSTAGTGGAGGGNGTPGGNPSNGSAIGGTTTGTFDLTNMVFGGGGSGGEDCIQGGNGGNGGGMIIIFSKIITVSGAITANGQNGQNVGGGSSQPGGGGAGGSILIKGQTVTIGANSVIANGGSGGVSGAGRTGGGGGAGRIRIE